MNTVPHNRVEITPVTLDGPDLRLDSHPEASATLLLVDDEPIILDVLRELLHPTGHRIITAANGCEALGRITHDPPDLILLDLIMPKMDGFELCLCLKTSPRWWTIPIIVLTASDQPEVRARAIDCGADDVMFKPPNEAVLLARVRGYLHAKAATDTRLEREAYARLIIESALEAIVSCDAHGMITTWNAQAEALFGWSCQEAMGQPLKSLIVPPRLRDAHEHGLLCFQEAGEEVAVIQRTEAPVLHRDGHEFSVELTLTLAREGHTQLFNAFMRDVTTRQGAERALPQAKDTVDTTH